MQITITGASYATNNGDGSSTIRLSDSIESLKRDYFTPKYKTGDKIPTKWSPDYKTVLETRECTQEEYEKELAEKEKRFEDALSGDSPYDYGYIDDKVIIELNIDEEGKATFKSIHLDDGN